MSRCAAFGHELDALGIWWPQGDGAVLRGIAAGWLEMADFVDDMAAALNGASGRLLAEYAGPAADAFQALWVEWSTNPGYLRQTAADCRRLANSLTDFSLDVDAADHTIVHLIELALGSMAAASSGPAGPGGPGSPSLTALDEEWIRWLDEQATMIGRTLAQRADRCGHHLQATDATEQRGPNQAETIDLDLSIGDRTVVCRSPAEMVDLGTIDPEAIEWVHPGTPVDLRHLGAAPVDFGAGQGDDFQLVPTTHTTCPPPPDVPPFDSDGLDDRAPDDNAPGDSAPGDDSPGDLPTSDLPSGAVPLDGLSPAELRAQELPVILPPVTDGAAPDFDTELPDPAAVASSGPPVLVPPPAEVGPPLDIAAFDLAAADDRTALGAPVEAPLPLAPLGRAIPGTDTSAGNPAASTSSSSGSGRFGRMPFPMMPMGAGGGASDDGEEPRRRRMRHSP